MEYGDGTCACEEEEEAEWEELSHEKCEEEEEGKEGGDEERVMGLGRFCGKGSIRGA